MLQMLSCAYEGRQGEGDVMFRHTTGLVSTSKIIMDARKMASMGRVMLLSEHADTAQAAYA